MFAGKIVALVMVAPIAVFALVAPVDSIPAGDGALARCSVAPFFTAFRGPNTLILGLTRADTVPAGVGAVEPTAHGGHWGSGRPREVYGQLVRVLQADGPEAGVLGQDSLLVIVPWDYDPACKPTYWSRSAAWIAPDLEGSYSLRLRPRELWGDYPIADAFMADLHPYPHAPFFAAGYRGTRALQERPSLTAREYFSLQVAMPTPEEIRANSGSAFERLLAWEAANPGLSTRYPADEILAIAKRHPRQASGREP
jgi:hypothetical protein